MPFLLSNNFRWNFHFGQFYNNKACTAQHPSQISKTDLESSVDKCWVWTFLVETRAENWFFKNCRSISTSCGTLQLCYNLTPLTCMTWFDSCVTALCLEKIEMLWDIFAAPPSIKWLHWNISSISSLLLFLPPHLICDVFLQILLSLYKESRGIKSSRGISSISPGFFNSVLPALYS